MPERIAFLTGRLAEPSLRRVLDALADKSFEADVRQLGINVAGLLTSDMIRRRMPRAEADRIIVPGRCRGDLDALSRHYGVPVLRGPDDLKDLPAYLGHGARTPDLSGYDIRIFAEIVDAPALDIAQILARAQRYRDAGADVIDVGCLPDTPFPHLSETVRALRDSGFVVSVDSMNSAELLAGARAGADYLLSLNEQTLWVADEVEATPVLVPTGDGGLASLLRAMERLDLAARPYLADPILDPPLLGFTESIARYRELRRRRPEVEMLLGVGNVSELLDADTAGVNALLAAIAAELSIHNVLTTQVSAHARRAVHELDAARRLVHRARLDASLARDIDPRLLALHERHPFPYQPEEIAQTAAAVRDPSYRIEVSAAGLHLYNRDGLKSAHDPFTLFAQLSLGTDTGHAFYLGVELARAQIAWQLGKRYVQDQELRWGCASDTPAEDLESQAAPGATRLETGTRP